MRKYQHIDSLRGVAILMVIATHVGPALQETATFLTVYGRMGVQLFFVISALTLCLSMESRSAERYPVGNFFIRRYFRIAPMYILGVFIYSPLVFDHFPNAESTLSFYLLHVTLLHGFSVDAFRAVVPGGWSIGVEFIFYLIFPALFFLLRKYNKRMHLWGIFAFFIVVSLLQNLYFQLELPSYSSLWKYGYWSPLNQLPVFIVGIILYRAIKERKNQLPIISHFILFVCTTLCTLIIWQLKPLFYVSFVPLMSAWSFYHLFFIFESVVLLNKKWLQRIGQLSFSMYLLHFFVITYVVKSDYLDVFRGYGIISLMLFLAIVVFLTCLVSLLTEKFIELKFVKIAKVFIAWRETKQCKGKSSLHRS
ncbi:acyltransferase [Psychrobium sp. MM17-31]|uniref:acyltransferase family protein n=1 Tax=Psychrobium sp. MM17-31 TaxID=2917758 RepID=UPI001EF67836|nr:acyltransferase [Psychrobium sp. MM17-31]MCG7531147.1 acyltransferase [Psychrobium sp. MM17-31]